MPIYDSIVLVYSYCIAEEHHERERERDVKHKTKGKKTEQSDVPPAKKQNSLERRRILVKYLFVKYLREEYVSRTCTHIIYVPSENQINPS